MATHRYDKILVAGLEGFAHGNPNNTHNRLKFDYNINDINALVGTKEMYCTKIIPCGEWCVTTDSGKERLLKGGYGNDIIVKQIAELLEDYRSGRI